MRELTDVIEEVFEAQEKNNRDTKEIAHYTTVDAFEKISKTIYTESDQNFINLWFTDVYDTNDKTEMSFGYDFVIDSFSAFEILNSKEDRFLITKYEDELKRSDRFKCYTPEQIKYWLIRKEATPYILSLTRKIDDTDMWLKTYGNGGDGVCLVFDFLDLKKSRYQEDFLIHGPFSIIYGNRVGYLEERIMLQEAVGYEYQRFIEDVCRLNDFDSILGRKIMALDQVCSLVSSFIKGEKWHNECEERLAAHRHFLFQSKFPKPINEYNGKKHIEISIPISCLKRIIIGPKTDKKSIAKVKDCAKNLHILPENVIISQEPIK